MGGGRPAEDGTWTHFNIVRDDNNDKIIECSCKHCDYTSQWPKVERLRIHLAKCLPSASGDSADAERGDGAENQQPQGQDQEEPNTSSVVLGLSVLLPSLKVEPESGTDNESTQGAEVVERNIVAPTRGNNQDPVWKYFSCELEKGKRRRASCKFCNYSWTWPKVERIRVHFEKFHPNIVASESSSVPRASKTPQSQSSSTKCIFCRQHMKTDESHASDDVWKREERELHNKQFAKALCELLELDKSFRVYFNNAPYCGSCEIVVEKVDSTLKALRKLRKTLSTSRETLENLLKQNYEKVALYLEPLKCSARSSPYDYTIKRIYEALHNNRNVERDLGPVIAKVTSDSAARITQTSSRPRRSCVSKYGNPSQDQLESDNDMYGDNDNEMDLDKSADFEPSEFLEEKSVGSGSESDFGDDLSDEDFEPSVPKHKKGKHHKRPTEEPTHPCKHCGKLFHEKKQLERHIRSIHVRIVQMKSSQKKYIVNVKAKSFTRKFRNTGNGRKRLLCTVEKCEFSCYKQYQLDAHVRGTHEGDPTPFVCDHCSMKFAHKTSYHYHYIRHTRKPNKTCEYCGGMFYEQWSLKKHITKVHLVQKKLRCMVCTFKFELDKGEEFQAHKLLHEERSMTFPYSCVMCDIETFTNYCDLRKHVRIVHLESESESHKCHKCERLFLTAKVLKRHIDAQICEQNPTLMCVECKQYVAKNKGDLIRHLRTHDGARDHMCDTCGKTYKTFTALRLHKRVHTGERPYQCQKCPKSFTLSHMLRNHEEIHSETKKYACDQCGKTFRTPKNRMQHRRSHCHLDGPRRKHKTERASLPEDEGSSSGTGSPPYSNPVSEEVNMGHSAPENRSASYPYAGFWLPQHLPSSLHNQNSRFIGFGSSQNQFHH